VPIRPESPLTLRDALRPFAKRFALAMLYFVVLFAGGSAGYVIIEGWGWFDSLYMTVTIATSLGIMEVHPLSTGGRTLTMIIVTLGVTGLGVWWGLIVALFVEMDLGGIFRRRRVLKDVRKLEGHYIVAGAGRIGRVVVREMLAADIELVVVEQDAAKLNDLREQFPSLLCLTGDATKVHTLQLAGIERARGLAACLGEDADNLLVSLTARGLKQDLRIVARAFDEESLEKMRRAGADLAISPNVSGGVRMASVLLRPHALSYFDIATRGGEMFRIEETLVPPHSPLVGQTLAEARIPQQTGLLVLAVRRATSGEMLANPGPDTHIEAEDVLIVVGEDDGIRKLRGQVRSAEVARR
jgi:voltage-gated potassium channel